MISKKKMNNERKRDIIASFLIISIGAMNLMTKKIRSDMKIKEGRLQFLEQINNKFIKTVKLSNTSTTTHDKLFESVKKFRRKKIAYSQIHNGRFQLKDLSKMMCLLLLELNYYGESLEEVYDKLNILIHDVINKDMIDDLGGMDYYDNGITLDPKYSNIIEDMRTALYVKRCVEFR